MQQQVWTILAPPQLGKSSMVVIFLAGLLGMTPQLAHSQVVNSTQNPQQIAILHWCSSYAACGMIGAMPNPGLRRMLAPWPRPEPFLGEVIRHSLAPAEDQNTEQTAIRFAKHTSP
jgi:hypothetical protein